MEAGRRPGGDDLWRRRMVHDLTFAVEGIGWHAPEVRDGIGYRWTGPGRLSVLRIAAPQNGARGEVHLVAPAGPPTAHVDLYLGGRPLEVVRRPRGPLTVLEFAYGPGWAEEGGTAEFWFHVGEAAPRFGSAPDPRRSVGVAVACVVLEPEETLPPAPGQADDLTRLIGRALLDQALAARVEASSVTPLRETGTEALGFRLRGLVLGPARAEAVLVRLCRSLGSGAVWLELRAEENSALGLGRDALRLVVREGEMLGGLDTVTAASDRLALAALARALPRLASPWLGGAMAAADPDVRTLSAWHAALRETGRAATRTLAQEATRAPDALCAALMPPRAGSIFAPAPEG